MISVILTCFNRCGQTVKCIESLVYGNPKLKFQFIVVDDKSTDGTVESLKNMRLQGIDIRLIEGSGDLYWAGGMRLGIDYAKSKCESEYYLLVNDDVLFVKQAIEGMIDIIQDNQVLVGSTCDECGKITYGGIRYRGKGIHYDIIGPDAQDSRCDTFNANCVLMNQDIFKAIPNIDSRFKHSLGDFDYGLSIKKSETEIRVAPFFVGECSGNDTQGTWLDRGLSRHKRWILKEQIKGAPTAPWFYFLKKNFGIVYAVIYSITPYMRIILGR